MLIVTVILTIAAVGALLWIANNYLPIADKILKIINIVTLIGLAFWLMDVYGVGI